MTAQSLVHLTWAELGIIFIACSVSMVFGWCMAVWMVDKSGPPRRAR